MIQSQWTATSTGLSWAQCKGKGMWSRVFTSEPYSLMRTCDIPSIMDRVLWLWSNFSKVACRVHRSSMVASEVWRGFLGKEIWAWAESGVGSPETNTEIFHVHSTPPSVSEHNTATCIKSKLRKQPTLEGRNTESSHSSFYHSLTLMTLPYSNLWDLSSWW